MQKTSIRIFRDLEALSQAAADAFNRLANTSIAQSGEFTVALTGGNTVERFYELLSFQPHANQVEWDKVRFFWGDERLVPPDHVESNYGQADRILLDRVGVKPENVFRIRGEWSSQDAVEDYDGKLKLLAESDHDWPRFDLVLLGMGSDGHIASIFPGEISNGELRSPVVATTTDYQGRPGERVSLTPLVFNSAKNIFFLVAGEGKAAVLARVFDDQADSEKLPVLRIQPKDGDVTWFVDEAAASQLPKELPFQEAD